MNIQSIHSRLVVGTVLLALLVPGCIFVRTTDHRVDVNRDGSGQGFLRLIDIRSDQTVDSLLVRDFEEMMIAYGKPGVAEFEQNGRKITSKAFSVHGDTLILDITYTFSSLEGVEGLRVTPDELYIALGEGREVVKTDGKVSSWLNNTKRIVWATDATTLHYVVREKNLPPSVSLASLYRKWQNK